MLNNEDFLISIDCRIITFMLNNEETNKAEIIIQACVRKLNLFWCVC